jgi:hypothetical protein
VAALLRRDLLEDAALEFMACGSPSVGRRSGGALCCLSDSLTSARLASCSAYSVHSCVCLGVHVFLVSWVQHHVSVSPFLALLI